jgi:low affinity Fe/Cu permease
MRKPSLTADLKSQILLPRHGSAPWPRICRRTRLMEKIFTQFAHSVSRAAGRPLTFVLCCIAIILWAATGPLFGFSDTWQLVVNTSTTIITFLMVFLIQNTQNRDGAAIQAKLDELLRAVSDARNEFIGIEHLTEM